MPVRPTPRVQRVFAVAALTAALSIAFAPIVAAQTPAPYVKVFIDGSPVALSQPPVMARGRVLVPLRGVFERLGATVTWDALAQTLLAQRGATTVSLHVGATQAFVNGQAQYLDAPPMLIGGSTMVPLRFVSQALGAAVTWDAAASAVQITSQGTAVSPAPGATSTAASPAAPVAAPAQGVPSGASVPAGAPGVNASVTATPAGRPLGFGDLLTVTATGPTHAAATYTITRLRTGLLMSESPTHPGTYVGYYTVRPGDKVANTNVVVTMTAPDRQMVTATAPAPVTIDASIIVPPAASGAPVISSPAPLAGVGTPFTVTGTAPPGSIVKVQAVYTGSVLFFNVRGTLGTQTVTADANGDWSATFAQAPPVRGVDLTISAAVVDNTGRARSPSTSIHTTVQ
ncbi:MAG TPA: copper amine oxidase N-terminal domain-containing protein [bacterium]|nr:copper amine oxidase N-terminal domain-containing protein [bacterium]